MLYSCYIARPDPGAALGTGLGGKYHDTRCDPLFFSMVAEADRLNVLQDEAMLKRWQALDTLAPEDRERIVSVVDSLLRDARARDAYRGVAASR